MATIQTSIGTSEVGYCVKKLFMVLFVCLLYAEIWSGRGADRERETEIQQKRHIELKI